jgi:tRNA(Ile)-lysidine synthetase-like protein
MLRGLQGVYKPRTYASRRWFSSKKKDWMDNTRGFPLQGSIVSRVHDSLTKCDVTAGSTLILQVSGGVDSMAMLHLIAMIKKNMFMDNLDLHVLNFNHQLRVQESVNESRFVSQWCDHYNIPFHTHTWEKIHDNNASGLPASAREWRRTFSLSLLNHLLLVKKKNDNGNGIFSGCIATAHHSDDQLETCILKLLRGVHITHLHGMLPKSVDGNYIKPLLDISKAELTEFMLWNSEFNPYSAICTDIEREGANINVNDITWFEDESNQSRKYKRNAVRLDIIPLLERHAGVGNKDALKKHFEKLSEQSLDLREWVEKEAQAFIDSSVTFYESGSGCEFSVLPSHHFLSLAKPVQTEVFHTLIHRLHSGKSVDYNRIKELVQLSTEQLGNGTRQKEREIRGNWMAERIGNTLKIKKKLEKVENFLTRRLHCTLPNLFGYVDLPSSCEVHVTNIDQNCSSCIEEADGSEVIGAYLCNIPSNSQIHIRYAKAGDKFQSPVGALQNNIKSLTHFLRQQDIPVEKRGEIPIVTLASAENENVNVLAVLCHGQWVVSPQHKAQCDETTYNIALTLRSKNKQN